MMPAIALPQDSSSTPSSGARLVATDGRTLPLAGTSVIVDAAGGVARVVLEQRFKNPHAEPLSVTYSLPLPADGAVSGFAFHIGQRRVVGEIDTRNKARERYEQALVEGRSAALLEQDRSSLFTQEIGNIPPGAEIIAEVTIDQRLRWLDEGQWEWRFPTVVAPRYLGEPGRVPDAARVAQDVADGPIAARAALRCMIRDALPEGRRPESPSHAIELSRGAEGAEVTLREGARLDRDLVVRWAAAAPSVGLSLDVGRPPQGLAAGDHAAYGLLTLVPPAPGHDAAQRSVARDMIVLLDTSGSMGGEPLAQAVRVVSALVETLRDQDQLELIEFSMRPRRWKKGPVAATAEARKEALAWLRALRASGGTEMREGIFEALSGLRAEAQRQVVLVTDGQIGFESQVVEAILKRLPAGSRLHTVGVGSAVNRSLTGPAARAGRGVEVVIGLGEDPERAAWRIVGRTRAPLVVELVIDGSAVIDHAPARLPDLFAGAPALVGVSLRPEGGELRVRGRTASGAWEQRIQVPAAARGEGSLAAAALYGREAVEDLEMKLAAGEGRKEIDAGIERLGLNFQIATRLTSWVAVTKEVTVDPGAPTRRERMPHELPHGMSAEGLGLRAPMGVASAAGEGGMVQAQPTPVVAASMDLMEADVDDEMAASAMDRVMPLPPFPQQVGGRAKSAPAGRAELRVKAKKEARDEGPPPPAYAPAAPPPPPMARPVPPPKPAAAAPVPPPQPEAKPTAAKPVAAPEPAPAPARPGGGILRRVAKLFSGESEEKESRAPAAEESKAAPAKGAARRQDEAAPARRTLRGRVALQREDAVILEITVDGAALDWAPEGAVELVLADGTTVTASAVTTLSTRAGQLGSGQIARLGVALRGMLASPPRRAILRRGGVELVIEL